MSLSADDEEDLTISFKIKTVDIRRPWMETALLNYKSLTLADAEAGQWSTGQMTPSNQGSFTLLPTSMVLASDVTVKSTKISSHTSDVIEKHISSGGTIVSIIYNN